LPEDMPIPASSYLSRSLSLTGRIQWSMKEKKINQLPGKPERRGEGKQVCIS